MKKQILIFLSLIFAGLISASLANAETAYSLNYMRTLNWDGSWGPQVWTTIIQGDSVIAQDADVIYSTTQGNWLPANTKTDSLKLKVAGTKVRYAGKDPRAGIWVMYRVWDNTKVSVQSLTWGNHGQQKLNRTDIFQRASETQILINGASQAIAIGGSYEIQRFTWNPGDNGQGLSYLKINNINSSYFDVEQFVWEYDEEHDTAYTRIDSYIQGAAPPAVAPTVLTNDATNVQETSATLNGNITNTGGVNCDQRGFEWGTSPGSYPNSWTESGSFGTGVFSHAIDGLNPGATYYFRAKAHNSAGWGYGDEKSVITLSPPTCQNHNVWGWAWSENIGWLSFSCRNTMAEGAGINYGVDIATTTGIFSGYAWSENIGWLQLNPLGPYPALPNYSVKVDLATQKVTGWARFLNFGDGWDGWVKFGYGPQGNYIDSNGDFHGWTWGSDVVGWISLNHADSEAGGKSLYKVKTTFSFNQPPSATDLQVNQPDYCTVPWAAAIFSWQFSDPNGDSQSAYQVQVDNDSNFSSPENDSGKVISSSNSYATPSGKLSFSATYYWRIMVWDSKDVSSSWVSGPSFTTPKHAYPSIDFTWTPQNPTVNEDTQFADKSEVYGGTTKSSWFWTFQDGSPDTSALQDPLVKFLSIKAKSVTLRVTDSDGFNCTGQKTVNTLLQLPEWKEIPPF